MTSLIASTLAMIFGLFVGKAINTYVTVIQPGLGDDLNSLFAELDALPGLNSYQLNRISPYGRPGAQPVDLPESYHLGIEGIDSEGGGLIVQRTAGTKEQVLREAIDLWLELWPPDRAAQPPTTEG